MSTKKQEKQEEVELKNKLESLIMGNLGAQLQAQPEDLQAQPITKIAPLSMFELKTSINERAKTLLKNLAEFYLNAKIISEDNYLKYKIALDEMTIATFMFQLHTAEHACIKILEEIDGGNTNHRIFEVLSKIQTSIVAIAKTQTEYMVVAEENYKRLQRDYDIKQKPDDTADGELSADGSVKTRGSRNLIEAITQINLDEKNQASEVKVENLTSEADADKFNPKKSDNSEHNPLKIVDTTSGEDETPLDDDMLN